MALIADYILDLALAELDTATATLHICSSEPANYAGIAAVQLGTKTSLSIGAPADRTPNGRKVTVASFSDGAVSATGTATHYAISKSGTTLMVTGSKAPALINPRMILSLTPASAASSRTRPCASSSASNAAARCGVRRAGSDPVRRYSVMVPEVVKAADDANTMRNTAACCVR